MGQVRNHYITITCGIRGYFAVMRAEYLDDGETEWFEDNVQSGIGSYASYDEAIQEAEEWARAEEIPVVVHGKRYSPSQHKMEVI
jgi:hypothetical protein